MTSALTNGSHRAGRRPMSIDAHRSERFLWAFESSSIRMELSLIEEAAVCSKSDTANPEVVFFSIMGDRFSPKSSFPKGFSGTIYASRLLKRLLGGIV